MPSSEARKLQGRTRVGTVPDNEAVDELSDEYQLPLAYEIERAMYAVAIVLGAIASVYTIHKFRRCCKQNLNVAARLLSYKISLSVADGLILFVYAPTQVTWITTFWWFGGDVLCRFYKFITTFAFHLTANMQVLIAFDRLTTMTHLNEVHAGTNDFNARLFLFISWTLALIPSVPQLFIFKIIYVDDNIDCPQCSTIWNECTILYEKYKEKPGSTSVHVENYQEVSQITNSSIEEDWLHMLEWERVYNIVHISTMCIIPYLFELILYTLILAVLSNARKGEFSGVKSVVQKKFASVRRTTTKTNNQFIPQIMADDIEKNTHAHHNKCSRRISRSANTSPKRELLTQPSNSTSRRKPLLVDAQGFNKSYDAPRHLLTVGQLPRRATYPPRSTPKSINAPWVRTVTVVRRKARRKAFLMLSCNLILWLPYCFHAIISSFVDLNYFHYQFASALIVFNAITNILL